MIREAWIAAARSAYKQLNLPRCFFGGWGSPLFLPNLAPDVLARGLELAKGQSPKVLVKRKPRPHATLGAVLAAAVSMAPSSA